MGLQWNSETTKTKGNASRICSQRLEKKSGQDDAEKEFEKTMLLKNSRTFSCQHERKGV